MKRRTWLGAFAGGVVTVFATLIDLVSSKAKASPNRITASVHPQPYAEPLAPTAPAKDCNGHCIKHVYRQNAAGKWALIPIAAICVGDVIIMIGQDKERLFDCLLVKVKEVLPPERADGCPTGAVIPEEFTDLMERGTMWARFPQTTTEKPE